VHFIQTPFLVLLSVVCALVWVSPNRTVRNAVLVAASYVFYGWVHPWFVAILLTSTLLDYTVALAMERHPAHKRALLGASLVGNLGLLGVFKYADFFLVSVTEALQTLGVTADLGTLELLLPVGISFYTFQTLSYTIDVYRGTVAPRRSLLDYALYVGFFPQLVAGPIERASRLLPQIERHHRPTVDQIASGISLAVWGAFKKVCIADVVGAYVDQVHMLKDPAPILVWASAIGFGTQILADFSAYTDIARGVARMLGFELVRNFRWPYLATTTPEFWHRWHISLSEWVRDYLYDPLLSLGRPSLARMVSVTMVTFFLLGLWHGPSWNFILLGLWHGTAVVAYTLLTPLVPRNVRQMPGGSALALVLHHVLVLIPGGLLFRETDLSRVWSHLTQLPWTGNADERLAASYIVLVSLTVSLPALVHPWVHRAVQHNLRGTPWIWTWRTTAWTLAAILVHAFASTAQDDFIYFAF
jgi:D-alanyl-lipoteichoic acid acyltransferase DltB (MBOAT superfamily)